MAWTLAVVGGIVGLAFILVLLNNSFERSRQGMKVLLTMITFALLILLSQVIHLIIQDKAGSNITSNMQTLSVANLVVVVTLFSFFIIKSLKNL